MIFVVPPSVGEHKSRLSGRGTEAGDVIAKRLERAKDELALMDDYDYIVVNNDVKEAAEQIVGIMHSEALKTKHSLKYIKEDLGL